MEKSHLKLVTPTAEKRTVPPKRPPNKALRTREYLTEAEVAKLMESAKSNRYGQRDSTLILTAFRHGLRAAELVDLRWDQVDFQTATLAVRRVKKGTASTHPILGDELRKARRAAKARARTQIALCVHFGKGRTIHYGWFRANSGTGG